MNKEKCKNNNTSPTSKLTGSVAFLKWVSVDLVGHLAMLPRSGALGKGHTSQHNGLKQSAVDRFLSERKWPCSIIFKWHPHSMLRMTSTKYKARQKQRCLLWVTGSSLCSRRIQNGLMSKPGPFTYILSWGLTKQCVGLVPRPADSSATFELTPVSDLRERVIWGQLLYCSVMSCKGFPVVEEERERERQEGGGQGGDWWEFRVVSY